MNGRVRRPAARNGVRSQMLNSAGKTRVLRLSPMQVRRRIGPGFW